MPVQTVKRAFLGLRIRREKTTTTTKPLGVNVKEERTPSFAASGDEDNATIGTANVSDDELPPPPLQKPQFSFRTMGGAYHTTLVKSSRTLLSISEHNQDEQQRQQQQQQQQQEHERDLNPVKCNWKTCRVTQYHRYSPDLTLDSDVESSSCDGDCDSNSSSNSSNNNSSMSSTSGGEDSLVLKRKPRTRELPSTWYFASNHVLVNRERSKRNLPPLIRCSKLDELARQHAAAMVKQGDVSLSDTLLISGPHRRLGQNAASGTCIREMHRYMMKKSKGDKNNILDTRYKNFGMGTAPSPDGRLYLCQIFKG